MPKSIAAPTKKLWTCPKCGSVNAPWVGSCQNVNLHRQSEPEVKRG